MATQLDWSDVRSRMDAQPWRRGVGADPDLGLYDTRRVKVLDRLPATEDGALEVYEQGRNWGFGLAVSDSGVWATEDRFPE